MSLYRKLTPAEVLERIAEAKRNTKPAPVIQEVPVSITADELVRAALVEQVAAVSEAGDPLGVAEKAKKTNARYKIGQAAYMRAYRARKKAEGGGK